MAKRKQKKIFRFISIILTVVTLISTNGSFLVWGMSGGDLGFTGVPKVQAKVARAITVEEIQKEAQQQKSHWWDFLWFGKNGREAKKGFSKFNMTYGEDTIKNGVDDRKSIFTDLKTELVAREVLGDKVVDVFNEEDGEPISKKIGWAEDVNQNGGSVTRYALKNNNDSREQVAINNKQQITNGKNNNLFQNATTQLVEEGENVKSKDQFQQNDIDDISKYIEVIEINAPKKHFWNKWWEWFRQIFSSDAKTSILGNSSNNKIKKVNKPNAYNPNSGKPLVIAIIDSGSDIHRGEGYNIVKPEILEGDSYTDSPSLVKNDNIREYKMDDVKHGTQIEGAMFNVSKAFGEGVRSGEIKIVFIKASDDDARTFDDKHLIKAIKKAKEIGANVVNFSIGGFKVDTSEDRSLKALQELSDSGAVIFAGAGNDGYLMGDVSAEVMSYTADNPDIIMVSAVDHKSGQIAGYANGSKNRRVDLYATELVENGGTSTATAVAAAVLSVNMLKGEITDNHNDGIDSKDVQKYLQDEPVVDRSVKLVSGNTASYMKALGNGWDTYDKQTNKFTGEGRNISPSEFGIFDSPNNISRKFNKYKEKYDSLERSLVYEEISLYGGIASGRAHVPSGNYKEKVKKLSIVIGLVDRYGFNIPIKLRRFDGDDVGEYIVQKQVKDNQVYEINLDELMRADERSLRTLTVSLEEQKQQEEGGFWSKFKSVVGLSQGLKNINNIPLISKSPVDRDFYERSKKIDGGGEATFTKNGWTILDKNLSGELEYRKPTPEEQKELEIEANLQVQKTDSSNVTEVDINTENSANQTQPTSKNWAEDARNLRRIEEGKGWLGNTWDNVKKFFKVQQGIKVTKKIPGSKNVKNNISTDILVTNPVLKSKYSGFKCEAGKCDPIIITVEDYNFKGIDELDHYGFTIDEAHDLTGDGQLKRDLEDTSLGFSDYKIEDTASDRHGTVVIARILADLAVNGIDTRRVHFRLVSGGDMYEALQVAEGGDVFHASLGSADSMQLKQYLDTSPSGRNKILEIQSQIETLQREGTMVSFASGNEAWNYLMRSNTPREEWDVSHGAAAKVGAVDSFGNLRSFSLYAPDGGFYGENEIVDIPGNEETPKELRERYARFIAKKEADDFMYGAYSLVVGGTISKEEYEKSIQDTYDKKYKEIINNKDVLDKLERQYHPSYGTSYAHREVAAKLYLKDKYPVPSSQYDRNGDRIWQPEEISAKLSDSIKSGEEEFPGLYTTYRHASSRLRESLNETVLDFEQYKKKYISRHPIASNWTDEAFKKSYSFVTDPDGLLTKISATKKFLKDLGAIQSMDDQITPEIIKDYRSKDLEDTLVDPYAATMVESLFALAPDDKSLSNLLNVATDEFKKDVERKISTEEHLRNLKLAEKRMLNVESAIKDSNELSPWVNPDDSFVEESSTLDQYIRPDGMVIKEDPVSGSIVEKGFFDKLFSLDWFDDGLIPGTVYDEPVKQQIFGQNLNPQSGIDRIPTKQKTEENTGWLPKLNPLTWSILDTKKDHTPITPEEYAKQQSQTQQQTDDFRMYPKFEDNNYTGYDNKGDAGSEDVAKDVLFTVSNNQESSKLQEKLTVDNSSLKEYVSKLSNEDWYKLANQDESGFFGGLFENKEEKRARRIAKSAALKAETTIRENIQRAKGAGWSTDGINTPNERAYYFENYLRSNLRDVKDFSRDFKPNIQQKLEDLRSKKLQRMQTSKYLDELTVEFGGDKQKAEEELELRLARVKAMSIVPLTAEEMKNKTLRSGIGGTVDDNSKTLYLNVDNYNENKLLNALWHESRHMSAAGNANVTESTKKLFQESKKSFEEWKQEDQHFFKLEDNVNDKILRERYCYLTGSCGGFKDEPRARESQVEMDIERHCGGSGQSATQSQVDCLLHIYKTEPQKLKQDTQEFLEVIKPEKVLNVLHSVADTEQYGLGKNNGELVADTQRTFPAYDPKIDGPIYDEQGSKISVNSKKGLLSRAISWIPFIGGPKEATADPEGLITDGLVIRKATGPNAGEIVGYTEKGKNVNADIDTMMTSGDQEDLFGFGGNSSAQIQQDATDKQDFSWVKPWTWFNKKNNAKTTAEIDALDSFYTAGDTNGDGEDQVALNQQQTDGFRMYPEFEGVALKDISDEEWQKAAMESVNRASGSDILLGDNNMSGRNMDLFLEGAEMSSGVRDGAVLRGQGAKSQTQIDLERELKQLNEGGIRVDSNGVNTEARKEQIRNELYKINSGQVVQNTTDTNSGQVALNQKQVADDLENLMNDEELFGFVDDALLSSLPICPVFSQATTKMNSTKPQTGPCRGGASVFTNPINNGVKHLEEQVKGIPVVGGVVSIFGSGIKLLTSAVDKTAGFADKIIEGNYTAQDVINTVDTGLVALSLFTDSGISGTFVVGVVPDSVKDLTAGLFLPKDNKDSITWDQFTAQAPAEFKEGRNIKKPEDVVNYIAAAAYDAGVGIALDKLGISNLVVKESVKQVLLKNGVEIGRAFQSGDDKKIEKALIKLSEDTESKAKNIASGVVAGELYEAFGLNSENKVVQLIATRLQVKEQIKKATGDIFSGDKDVETALSEMVDNMDKNAAREVNRAIKELENAPETVQKALKKRLELAVENKEKELTGLIKDAVKINGNSAIVKYVNKTTSKTLDQAIEDASGFFFGDKTVKVDLNLDGVLEEITTEQAKQLRDKLNGKMGFIGLNIKKTEVGDIVLVSKTGENELARVNSEGKIISQEDRLSEELDKMMSENQDIFGLDSGEEQNSKKEDQDSTSKKASDSSKSASIGDSINNYIDETLDGLSIVPMEVEESKRLLETFSALPEEEQAKRKYLLNKPLSEMTGNEKLEYAHLTGHISDKVYRKLKKESESSVVGQEVVSVIGADNSKKQNSTIGQKTSQPESPSWFSKWWNSWSLPSLSSLFYNNDDKTEQPAAVGKGNTDDTKSKAPQQIEGIVLPVNVTIAPNNGGVNGSPRQDDDKYNGGSFDKESLLYDERVTFRKDGRYNLTTEAIQDGYVIKDGKVVLHSDSSSNGNVLEPSNHSSNNNTVSNPKYYWEDDFGEKYNLVSDKQYKKDGDSFVECSDDNDLTYSNCNYPNNLNGVIRVDGNAGNDRIVGIEDLVVDSIDVNTHGARPPTENDFDLGEFLDDESLREYVAEFKLDSSENKKAMDQINDHITNILSEGFVKNLTTTALAESSSAVLKAITSGHGDDPKYIANIYLKNLEDAAIDAISTELFGDTLEATVTAGIAKALTNLGLADDDTMGPNSLGENGQVDIAQGVNNFLKSRYGDSIWTAAQDIVAGGDVEKVGRELVASVSKIYVEDSIIEFVTTGEWNPVNSFKSTSPDKIAEDGLFGDLSGGISQGLAATFGTAVYQLIDEGSVDWENAGMIGLESLATKVISDTLAETALGNALGGAAGLVPGVGVVVSLGVKALSGETLHTEDYVTATVAIAATYTLASMAAAETAGATVASVLGSSSIGGPIGLAVGMIVMGVSMALRHGKPNAADFRDYAAITSEAVRPSFNMESLPEGSTDRVMAAVARRDIALARREVGNVINNSTFGRVARSLGADNLLNTATSVMNDRLNRLVGIRSTVHIAEVETHVSMEDASLDLLTRQFIKLKQGLQDCYRTGNQGCVTDFAERIQGTRDQIIKRSRKIFNVSTEKLNQEINGYQVQISLANVQLAGAERDAAIRAAQGAISVIRVERDSISRAQTQFIDMIAGCPPGQTYYGNHCVTNSLAAYYRERDNCSARGGLWKGEDGYCSFGVGSEAEGYESPR